MNAAHLIARKRDGHALTADEIAFFVRGFDDGTIPDYQMSAMAMAIFLNDMSTDETAALTECMLHSGHVLQWQQPGLYVDKHSTGGIGDKVSLILAPLLACVGLRVPMISGRGLGTTGGTLDKLESIRGFRTDLSMSEMQAIADSVGCVINGATAELAPADKKLYALRDVTGTVPSIPLITASIMSKKLAEGLDALVLDVKCGSGAFMKSSQQARLLAESLVNTGRRLNLETKALITDMNQPLGRKIGHAVEVDESIDTLKGQGPADLHEVTCALTAELMVMMGKSQCRDAAIEQLESIMSSGAALEKFAEMISAQSGDLDAPREIAPESVVAAKHRGFIGDIDTGAIGLAVIEMGGGRRVKTDVIDHAVGLEMLVRIGQEVSTGQALVRVFSRPTHTEKVQAMIVDAIEIRDSPVKPPVLIR
jgi:pyrimidine-nucleoside phosphorylase